MRELNRGRDKNKIIFITREGYNLSGARIRCYGFARELRRYNMEADVFSFADDLGALCGEQECSMSLSEKIKYNLRAFNRLKKKIDKNTIIFMQRFNYHSIAPFILSLLEKNKIIFDCDDWNIHENPVYHLGIYPSSKMEYCTRKIAKYADICIVASRFLEDYLRKFNPRVYRIPTGVDTDIFKPRVGNNGSTKIIFSWIGTVYHRQMGENIKFLLECFSIIANKYNNIFLDLAGEGKYFKEAKDGLDGYKHRDRIKFHDWIFPDNIPSYLSGIDVGLLPLIQNTKFNRSKSPTKLFEYMAMAKATISSKIGEAGQIIKDGQNGFLANNKDEFISIMESLITDFNLRRQIGLNARQTIEGAYSIKILGKQLYDIIKTI